MWWRVSFGVCHGFVLAGGVKGMFSLRLLERLLVKFPKLIDDVDLIAGTSTGGLIALMLANGYTPTQGFFLSSLVSSSGLKCFQRVGDLSTQHPADFSFQCVSSSCSVLVDVS